jgi:hypothetical protein
MQTSSKRRDAVVYIAAILFFAVLFVMQGGNLFRHGRDYIATENSSFTVQSVKSTANADGYVVSVRSHWWWKSHSYTLQCHHCSRPEVGETIRFERLGRDTLTRSIRQAQPDAWGPIVEFYTILGESN